VLNGDEDQSARGGRSQPPKQRPHRHVPGDLEDCGSEGAARTRGRDRQKSLGWRSTDQVESEDGGRGQRRKLSTTRYASDRPMASQSDGGDSRDNLTEPVEPVSTGASNRGSMDGVPWNHRAPIRPPRARSAGSKSGQSLAMYSASPEQQVAGTKSLYLSITACALKLGVSREYVAARCRNLPVNSNHSFRHYQFWFATDRQPVSSLYRKLPLGEQTSKKGGGERRR
jgi:hypothetical protein